MRRDGRVLLVRRSDEGRWAGMWEFPRGDQSWALEFAAFLDDIRLERPPSPGLADARAALAIVEDVHRQSGYLR